jgi:AraC family transcriptional regulator
LFSGIADKLDGMNELYTTSLARVVDRIERSLSVQLSLDDLAREAGLSKFHLHRVFRALTGYPLADYVRRRRLSETLTPLLGTNRTVLDIAVESGFEYEQSYIRAFRACWGISPGKCRKERLIVPMTERIDPGSFVPIGPDSALIEPRLVAKAGMTLCGIRHRITDEENRELNTASKVANCFHDTDMRRIEDPVFETRYFGYVEHCPDPSDNIYHTCAELRKDPAREPPEGMRYIRISGGTYREFLLVSRVHPSRLIWQDVLHLYGVIFGEWLPNHPEQARAGWHLEFVDDADASEDYGEFRVLIPVSAMRASGNAPHAGCLPV